MRQPLALFLVLCLWGCGPKPPDILGPPTMKDDAESLSKRIDLPAQDLVSWTDLEPAIEASLRYVLLQEQNDLAVDRPGLKLTWRQLGRTLELLRSMLAELDKDPTMLARHFTWQAVEPGTLLTGYYEPLIEASLTPSTEYPYPIHARPPDLRKGEVYPLDRKAIEFEGKLKGRNLEIAWAKDPVDAYFLQVQGSGRLKLPDDSVMHILYDGSTSHEYVSLGRLLIDMGLATKEEMSMQTIRRILDEKPELVAELFPRNPRYVFFRLAKEEGPLGAMGAPITPRVSVAVDKSFLPLGAFMVLSAELPGFETDRPERMLGPVLAQDTGSMHTNHLDLFCGFGPKAEHQAGHMKGTARVFLLVAKSAAPGR